MVFVRETMIFDEPPPLGGLVFGLKSVRPDYIKDKNSNWKFAAPKAPRSENLPEINWNLDSEYLKNVESDGSLESGQWWLGASQHSELRKSNFRIFSVSPKNVRKNGNDRKKSIFCARSTQNVLKRVLKQKSQFFSLSLPFVRKFGYVQKTGFFVC